MLSKGGAERTEKLNTIDFSSGEIVKIGVSDPEASDARGVIKKALLPQGCNKSSKRI
jgi:hypothetical protein